MLLGGHGVGRAGGGRSGRPGAALGLDDHLGGAVGAAALHPQRRPALVLLRVGDAAGRGRVSRHPSWTRRRGPSAVDHVGAAVAAVSGGVRRRPGEDARRPMLAGPDVPRLPPRNPADAQPVQLALSSPAHAPAPGGGAGQPHHPAGRRVRTVCAPTVRHRRCARHDRHPGVADAQRQLRVAQPADRHIGPVGAR